MSLFALTLTRKHPLHSSPLLLTPPLIPPHSSPPHSLMSLVKLPDDDCVFCWDSLLERTCIVIRPCGHTLHLDCSHKLDKCPACRGPIVRNLPADPAVVPGQAFVPFAHLPALPQINENPPADDDDHEDQLCHYVITRGDRAGQKCNRELPHDGIPYCRSCRRTRKVRRIMTQINFNDYMHIYI